jgi:hypothetical protein
MAGILGDGNAFFVKRLSIRSRRFADHQKKIGTGGRNGGVGRNAAES